MQLKLWGRFCALLLSAGWQVVPAQQHGPDETQPRRARVIRVHTASDLHPALEASRFDDTISGVHFTDPALLHTPRAHHEKCRRCGVSLNHNFLVLPSVIAFTSSPLFRQFSEQVRNRQEIDFENSTALGPTTIPSGNTPEGARKVTFPYSMIRLNGCFGKGERSHRTGKHPGAPLEFQFPLDSAAPLGSWHENWIRTNALHVEIGRRRLQLAALSPASPS